MKQELDKCVLVIDEAMPRGLAANTAAHPGHHMGPAAAGTGRGGRDRRCRSHPPRDHPHAGAGALGRPETFQTLRRQLAELEFADVAAVDFTDLAQSCRTYGEFIEKMARTGPGSCDTWAWPFWAPGIRWTG